ncbi:MAG TPA: hypothetical protein VMF52_02260 [Steroidobacteraceae bacterium]|nr:hypothetical protein [Steroidobacteraceae bacterium]
MAERQLPDRDPGLAPDPGPPSTPEITTSATNIQDVEHDARPDTRVNNAGVKVNPRATEQKLDEALTHLPPD